MLSPVSSTRAWFNASLRTFALEKLLSKSFTTVVPSRKIEFVGL